MLESIATIADLVFDGVEPHAHMALKQGMDRYDQLMQQVDASEDEKKNRFSAIKSKFSVVAKDLCESPIEQVMLAALCMADYGYSDGLPHIHNVIDDALVPKHRVVIFPQFQIARYRLDFLIIARSDDHREQKWLAAECDGKDYHSDLKDVNRDKVRDKYLKSIGIETFRYPGKYIWKNQHMSADEIAATIAYWRKNITKDSA